METPPPMPPGPPPYQQAPKKGMHPMAAVGIGCGVLLLLTMVGGALFFRFAKEKYEDIKEKMAESPDRPAAMAIVEASPEVELVREDSSTGEVILVLKESRETVTTSYGDLASDRFRFTLADGSEHALGENAAPAPGWVPTYPNRVAPGVSVQRPSGSGVKGVLSFTTNDTMEMVKAFYAGETRWSNSTSNSSSSFGSSESFSSSFSRGSRSLKVEGAKQGTDPMRVVVTYQE